MNAVKAAARGRRISAALALALAASLLHGALPAAAEHFDGTVELAGDTAVDVAIAWSTLTFPETAQEALLGRSDDFPDSLASGVLQDGRPLLLTGGEELDPAVSEELERLAVTKVFILGGTGAISDAVETQLTEAGYETERLAGENRVATAVEVAKVATPDATSAIVARAFAEGDDPSRAFADSLAAGAWSAASGMPVLLTETEQLSEVLAAYLQQASITDVAVVGGTAAVSDNTVAQIEALGLTTRRVSGPTRFDTALAIASERGFASAADATRVILTEGQAADSWPSGFAAAALSKQDDAPVVLANQGELPEPTTRFLTGEYAEVGLVCTPSVAEEVCTAASEAMAKAPMSGLIEIAETAVGQYGEVAGTIANPSTVESLQVSGCGYTDEPVYVYDDGSFFILVSEQGTCTMSFAAVTSQGPASTSAEIAVGEPAAAVSFTVRPEAYQARVVKVDDEGAHIRVFYDEPIAAAITAGRYWLMRVDGDPNNSPIAAHRDPRSPRAVVVVYPEEHLREATAIAVGTNVGEADEAETSPAARDIDGLGNPEAYLPLKAQNATATLSDNPDLVAVRDFDPETRTAVFEFNRDVDPPETSDAGAAVLVMKDGTVREADADGFSAGPDSRSLLVSFDAVALSAEEWENVRRGFVAAETVPRKGETERANTPVAVVITGGGLTDGPDFIGFSNFDEFEDEDDGEEEDLTRTSVTFEFDEEVLDDFGDACAGGAARFVLIKTDGASLPCTHAEDGDGVIYPSRDDTQEVRVAFAGDLDTEEIAYLTVLDGAVTEFHGGQLPSRPDTIRNDVTKIYQPGETEGPDIDLDGSTATGRLNQSYDGGATCDIATATPCQTDLYELKFRFDEAVTAVLVDVATEEPSNEVAQGIVKVYWGDDAGTVATWCPDDLDAGCTEVAGNPSDQPATDDDTCADTPSSDSDKCWSLDGTTLLIRAWGDEAANFLREGNEPGLVATYIGLSGNYMTEASPGASGAKHTPPIGFGIVG